MKHLLRPDVIREGMLAERVVKFLAYDADVSRGGQTDPHPVAVHFQDCQGDVAADVHPFAGLPAEDEHAGSPP
jgi:hypothetical protein